MFFDQVSNQLNSVTSGNPTDEAIVSLVTAVLVVIGLAGVSVHALLGGAKCGLGAARGAFRLARWLAGGWRTLSPIGQAVCAALDEPDVQLERGQSTHFLKSVNCVVSLDCKTDKLVAVCDGTGALVCQHLTPRDREVVQRAAGDRRRAILAEEDRQIKQLALYRLTSQTVSSNGNGSAHVLHERGTGITITVADDGGPFGTPETPAKDACGQRALRCP